MRCPLTKCHGVANTRQVGFAQPALEEGQTRGLDWFDRVQAADAYRLELTDPDTVRAGLDEARKEVLIMTASSLAEEWGPFLSPADAAVLTGRGSLLSWPMARHPHPWSRSLDAR